MKSIANIAPLDQNPAPCEVIYLMTGLGANLPILLDGAMGTELIARGLQVREEGPEAWNLTRPADVKAVHESYIAVGATVLQTNSFGITRPRLDRFGLASSQKDLGARAVDLAKSAAGSAKVWGSIGPTGESLPLPGKTGAKLDLAWLEEIYAEAAAALVGVDAIHIETMFHPAEMEAAIRGARAGAATVPIYSSMTLMTGVTGIETPHGIPISHMIRAAQAGGPDAIGVNCSIDAEQMRGAVVALKEAFSLPVIAQPQAKLSAKCATGKSSESPETFAKNTIKLVDAGASAVGGCCGIGPAGIAALRSLLDSRFTAPDPSFRGGRVHEVHQ